MATAELVHFRHTLESIRTSRLPFDTELAVVPKKPKKDSFFERKNEWGKYKHTILGKYIRGWFSKLARRSSTLAFIDTCAGEGVYGNGEAGSPLIAAMLNTSYARERGQKLFVFACEENPESADALTHNLEAYIAAGEAEVIREGFGTALPRIMERTRDIPTLVFIDPYGMKDLRRDNLKALLDDTARESTELIMRVPPQLLARFAGQVRKGGKVAESFRRLLEDLQISDELIRRATDYEGLDVGVGQAELLESFLEQIHDRFTHVQLIPIRDDYFADPKYFLVHGTMSVHGLILMNDNVSTTEDELYMSTQDKIDAGQANLFFDEVRERRPRVTPTQAQSVIVEVVTTLKNSAWIDICAALVKRFGPDLRQKDHRQFTRDLAKRGVIDRIRDKKKRELYDHYTLGSNSQG